MPTIDTTGIPANHVRHRRSDGTVIHVGRGMAFAVECVGDAEPEPVAVIDLAERLRYTWRGHYSSLGLGYAQVDRAIRRGLLQHDVIRRNNRGIRAVRLTEEGRRFLRGDHR